MLLIITRSSDKLTLNPKYGVLVFFAICGCNADFKSKLRRNGWRQSKTTCEQ